MFLRGEARQGLDGGASEPKKLGSVLRSDGISIECKLTVTWLFYGLLLFPPQT